MIPKLAGWLGSWSPCWLREKKPGENRCFDLSTGLNLLNSWLFWIDSFYRQVQVHKLRKLDLGFFFFRPEEKSKYSESPRAYPSTDLAETPQKAIQRYGRRAKGSIIYKRFAPSNLCSLFFLLLLVDLSFTQGMYICNYIYIYIYIWLKWYNTDCKPLWIGFTYLDHEWTIGWYCQPRGITYL